MKVDMAAGAATRRVRTSYSVAETPDVELSTFKYSNREEDTQGRWLKERSLLPYLLIWRKRTLSSKHDKQVKKLGHRGETSDGELFVERHLRVKTNRN